MSKERKISPSWFLAWNYDNEEDHLNRSSKRGWRLSEAHMFYKVYVRDKEEYRYRIDYNPISKLSYNDEKLYLDTFEDMGWHYISSVVGWNYFEKKVEEGNTEEDYCIYTDNTSLKGALLRWIQLARILEIICGIICVINLLSYFEGSKPNFLMGITSLIEVILFEFGIHSMKRKRIDKRKSNRSNVIIGNTLFIGMFACLVIGIIGVFRVFGHTEVLNTHYQGTFSVAPEGTNQIFDNLSFLVEDEGKYNLKARCATEYGTMLLTIYDGLQEVYTTSGSVIHVDEKLKFKEGIHRAKIAVDYGDLKDVATNFYTVNLEID